VTGAGPPAAAPLAGRRLYFVGIGGSGLSAYANIARAWGAEVRGWDVRDTIFMRTLDGIEIDVGGEPEPPEGWEPILSTAHAHRCAGTARETFLAELVASRPTIVVSGAHGKTTTAAMIAFALRETGRDPAWIVGGVVPQLGGNAGSGSGWLVVEGDESDRSLFALPAQIALVTNVELDHHGAYGSESELQAAFDAWLATVPAVVRSWELLPADFPVGVPGSHNRENAAAAVEALVLAGVARREAQEAIGRFTGVDRRFQLVGEAGGVTVIDDYGHNPTELRATLATARSRTPSGGRLVAVYQPHVNERTRHLYRELGEALGEADVAIVTEVTGARDAPRDNVSGAWVVDRVPRSTRALWAPTLDDAARMALHVVRAGDIVVTLGVGEPWKVAQAVVEGLRSRDGTAVGDGAA
jgi:UDP-N-acetylmuramate--alanine ligase